MMSDPIRCRPLAISTTDIPLEAGCPEGYKDVAEVSRELQVSEQTYYRWRNQFGGLKAHHAKRLKDLEPENATLKRLLADAELEKAALKEIAQGNL
jgi:putative transposase